MEKALLNTQKILIDNNKLIILKHFLEKPYVWTYVYVKENKKESYIGFYGNSLDKKMNEYIKYNKNYVVFCFVNSYVGNSEFIKKIYDINTKEFLGYEEYPEFKQSQSKTLKKVK